MYIFSIGTFPKVITLIQFIINFNVDLIHQQFSGFETQ
jgi:hypothetical protein